MAIPDRAPTPYEYIPTTETPAAHIYVATERGRPTIVIRTSSETVKVFEAFSSRIDDLEKKMEILAGLLQGKTVELLGTSVSFVPVTMSEAEALEAARAMFDKAGEETVYPSDIAEKLQIPYESVLTILQKLEADGKIEKS